MADVPIKSLLAQVHSQTQQISTAELELYLANSAQDVIRGLRALRNIRTFRDFQNSNSYTLTVEPGQVFCAITAMYANERRDALLIDSRYYKDTVILEKDDTNGQGVILTLDPDFYTYIGGFTQNKRIQTENNGIVTITNEITNESPYIDDLVIEFAYTITKDNKMIPSSIYEDFGELIAYGALMRVPISMLRDGQAGKDNAAKEYDERFSRARFRVEGGIPPAMNIPSYVGWGRNQT